jgi:hypothetical protein
VNRIVRTLHIHLILIATVVLGACQLTAAAEKDVGSACETSRVRWEDTVKDLKSRISEYDAIKETPLTRVTGRPLVSKDADKPIARQIAEAIQEKEGLLSKKRRECYKALTQENEAFSAFRQCYGDAAGKNRRAAKRLDAKRLKLIKQARIDLAEVREVEGKEQHYPQYVDYWRGQPRMYNGRMGDPWQYYRQLYRGYYGR